MFVGQAPGKSCDPDAPLAGKAGRKLARIFGCPFSVYLRCERINLNNEWLGRHRNGSDRFSVNEGKKVAEILLSKAGKSKYILLGRHVARCFGFGWKPLTVGNIAGKRFLLVPHPSGLNRWWNHKANVVEAKRALRRFLHEC